MNKILVNVETAEEQVVALSQTELAQVAAQQAEDAAVEQARQEADDARAAAKASANAKLAALGLTEEEISALVGGA